MSFYGKVKQINTRQCTMKLVEKSERKWKIGNIEIDLYSCVTGVLEFMNLCQVVKGILSKRRLLLGTQQCDNHI